MELWISLGFVVGGLVAIIYGMALFSVPAAWLTAGVVAVGIGLWPMLRSHLMGR